jgi:hypothetical protein
MAAVCSSSAPRRPDGSAPEGGRFSGTMLAVSVLHGSEPPVAVVGIAEQAGTEG